MLALVESHLLPALVSLVIVSDVSSDVMSVIIRNVSNDVLSVIVSDVSSDVTSLIVSDFSNDVMSVIVSDVSNCHSWQVTRGLTPSSVVIGDRGVTNYRLLVIK